MAHPAGLAIAPVDSASALGAMYGTSLVATLPLLVLLLALSLLRTASAGARAVACRAGIVSLLVIYAGPWLPVERVAWIVPGGLAAPLVALGTTQLAGADLLTLPVANSGVGGGGASGVMQSAAQMPWVQWLWVIYWLGVCSVLLLLLRGRGRLWLVARSALPCSSRRWRSAIDEACRRAGLAPWRRRQVRVLRSAQVQTPLTWGSWGATVMLPVASDGWSTEERVAALVHELSHVRQRDAWFALVARVACACFWFHPGVWWLARRLEREVELACDDRVLLGGVRRSDYASLLLRVLSNGHRGSRRPGGTWAPTMALARAGTWRGRGAVRERLAAIVDTTRFVRAPSPAAAVGSLAMSIVLALPLGTIRVAPTQDVLTSLLLHEAWESRAWAATRLALRPDTLDVARAVAEGDPNPRVRAWASLAVAGPLVAVPTAAPSVR